MNENDETLAPDGDRAKRAFRAAFEDQTGNLALEPLDPAAARRTAKSHATWNVIGVAAAATAIVVGAASIVQWVRDDGGGQTVSGPITTQPAEPSATPDDQGEPIDGWRYESYRDVQLQVPASWGYGPGSTSDWCVDDGAWLPKEPYVGRTDNQVVESILCSESPEEAPARLQVPHVVFSPLQPGASDEASGSSDSDLVTLKKPIGHALVTVMAPQTLAQLILDTAVVVKADHNGCPVSDPIQGPEFASPTGNSRSLAGIDHVDTIAICRYLLSVDASELQKPGLLSSAELEGRAAENELGAMKAAAEGGGPDDPSHCDDYLIGDEAVVLRLNDGSETNQVYVYYNWCFNNGLDDGTTKRMLTVDSCGPLFDALQLTDFSGSGGIYKICRP